MSNRIWTRAVLSVLMAVVLLTTAVWAADSGAGTMVHSTRVPMTPDLTYFTRSYHGEGELRQESYGMELAAEGKVCPIFMACDTIWGGMTMDDCVGYAQAQGYNVVAAMNTAFFNSPGVPIGVVVEQGILKSAAAGLNAFAILPDGSCHTAAAPKVTFTVTGEGEEPLTFAVERFNKLLSGDGLHLYNSAYSTVSTRVEDDVWVVRLRITEGEMRLRGTVTLEVTQALPDAKAVPIGDEYMILTAAKDGRYGDFYKNFSIGSRFTLEIGCTDEKLAKAEYVSGCGDILVENGKITDSAGWMPSMEGRHPRTLLGWKADGTMVLYAADGRNPGVSDGLTLRMAAEEMLRLGCVQAVNMDGGGSTVLGVRLPGQESLTTVNNPSDGAQRQCAGYLLLVTDAPRDGVVRHWNLRENGLLVASGQRVALHAFGSDGGLYPIAVSDRTVQFADENGVLHDRVFTAPREGGTYAVQMWGAGAIGSGEIQVVSQLTSLQVTNRFGTPVRELVLENGKSPELYFTASHNGYPVYADDSAATYAVDGKFGYVDDSGRFVARAFPGTTGTLTVTVGGISHDIKVTVAERSDGIYGRVKALLR